MQSTVFELLGIAPEEAQKKFGFLLDALKFGAPPQRGHCLRPRSPRHADGRCRQHPRGDRLPEDPDRRDPLTDAPTEVSEAQLRELHVRVRLPQP